MSRTQNRTQRRTRRAMALLVGLSLSGCFSGDDFSDCVDDEQCGVAKICNSGRCEFVKLPPDGAVSDVGMLTPDAARVTADVGVPVGPTLTGQLEQATYDFPGKRIELKDLQVNRSRGLFVVKAAVIEITGLIDADGRGNLGGGGGGGGAAGHAIASFDGGEPGDMAQAGASNSSVAGGSGGRGGAGGAALAGGALPSSGGAGGVENRAAGGAGEDGIIRDAPCDIGRTELIQGVGGGGGGGGVGGLARSCAGGGGGGGGGAGGPGGGAILIEAEQTIIVRARISARGMAGARLAHMSAAGGAACSGGAPGDCTPCEAGTGIGGAGAGANGTEGGPGSGALDADGGRTSGDGGMGGAGSGGMIKLIAPKIIFEDGAVLDVSGGADGNGGVIFLIGDRAGDPKNTGQASSGLCTSNG